MTPIFRNTGGIWITNTSLFGGTFGASWPFATLLIYHDKLKVKIDFTGRFSKIVFYFYIFGKLFKWNQEHTINFKYIDYIERKHHLPFFADGVKIVHHSTAPKLIIFWSLRSTGKIIELLKKQGIKIK